ncbi:MAG: M48 family metallopeptidase [Oscillospiraceae bacterium]|nr:M48 family metallopeptidase [Oscillospiraceae bacterium]
MKAYSILYSRRKTVAIYVTEDATVEVRAPLGVSKRELDYIVQSKQDWIERQLSLRTARAAARGAFALHYGDTVLLRGKKCPIEARDGGRVGFDGTCFYLPPNLPSEEIKRVVTQVYRGVAKELFSRITGYYAKEMGVTPLAVKVTGAKTRWGSCSGKGSINFSWRLIMADDDVIDYVVVHELAHLKEHNHSARFWAVVASVLPDYKRRKEGLKMLQDRLAAEQWD